MGWSLPPKKRRENTWLVERLNKLYFLHLTLFLMNFSYHYDLLTSDNTQKHKILAKSKIQQNKDKKCVRDGIL